MSPSFSTVPLVLWSSLWWCTSLQVAVRPSKSEQVLKLDTGAAMRSEAKTAKWLRVVVCFLDVSLVGDTWSSSRGILFGREAHVFRCVRYYNSIGHFDACWFHRAFKFPGRAFLWKAMKSDVFVNMFDQIWDFSRNRKMEKYNEHITFAKWDGEIRLFASWSHGPDPYIIQIWPSAACKTCANSKYWSS